jgi:hypothetical protein
MQHISADGAEPVSANVFRRVKRAIPFHNLEFPFIAMRWHGQLLDDVLSLISWTTTSRNRP